MISSVSTRPSSDLQPVDITPLEEARAFHRMLDKGYTVEELAQRLGIKQPWRISERTQLLARFEKRIEAVVRLAGEGFKGNEIVALRKRAASSASPATN